MLVTNATGLHLNQVREGLAHFARQDEIWAKLDVGTQEQMDRINRPKTSPLISVAPSLGLVLENILALGRQRRVVIQSLFPLLDGIEPSPHEIEAYVHRLRELKESGSQISLVQIYSAHRPACMPTVVICRCGASPPSPSVCER